MKVSIFFTISSCIMSMVRPLSPFAIARLFFSSVVFICFKLYYIILNFIICCFSVLTLSHYIVSFIDVFSTKFIQVNGLHLGPSCETQCPTKHKRQFLKFTVILCKTVLSRLVC